MILGAIRVVASKAKEEALRARLREVRLELLALRQTHESGVKEVAELHQAEEQAMRCADGEGHPPSSAVKAC